MTESLTEVIVERFYRFSEYLVERDVPLVGERGIRYRSDLDILAVKEEVVLVNCKDFVGDPGQKEKIHDNLKLAEECVRRTFPAIVGKKKIKRQFVYDSSDKATVDFLVSKGVECKPLERVLVGYLQALEKSMDNLDPDHAKYSAPKGLRWYLTGNLRGYDKLLQYLLNCKFIKLESGRIKTWEDQRGA